MGLVAVLLISPGLALADRVLDENYISRGGRQVKWRTNIDVACLVGLSYNFCMGSVGE